MSSLLPRATVKTVHFRETTLSLTDTLSWTERQVLTAPSGVPGLEPDTGVHAFNPSPRETGRFETSLVYGVWVWHGTFILQ